MSEFIEIICKDFNLEYCLRLMTGFLCGLILGIERKIRHHEVGVRTLSLMSLICSLLGIVSIEMAGMGVGHGDPTRIAAGVVTGIGFIGGGAILRHGLNIRGLTSAAIVFCSSGLGLACGCGLYSITFFCIFIILVILFVLEKLERRFFPSEKTKVIKLKFSGKYDCEPAIYEVLKEHGLIINDKIISYNADKDKTSVFYYVKTPDLLDTAHLANTLSKLKNIIKFSINNNQ